MTRRRRSPPPERVEPQRALSPEERAFVQYLAEEALRQWKLEHEVEAEKRGAA